MYNKISKIAVMLTNISILLIMAVLPIYMKNKMVMIGNAKYFFFLNRAVPVLAAACVVLLYQKVKFKKLAYSITDKIVFCFFAVSILSFLFSEDKKRALWGYDGWYMGLLSQVIFVLIYYAVSRGFDGDDTVWRISGATAIIVCGLGLINKMNYDPLGIYIGMNTWDWNRQHLLSTIGNQNWYCGYMSVTAGICFFYAYTKSGLACVLGYVGSILSIMSFLTQGSESAYPVMGILYVILLIDGLENRDKFTRYLRLAMLLPISCLFLQIWDIKSPRGLFLNVDGSMNKVLFFEGWGWILCVLVLLYLNMWRSSKKGEKDILKSGRLRRTAVIGIISIVSVLLFVFILCQISDTVWNSLGRKSLLRIDKAWGSGRGGLWYMSLESWKMGGIKTWILGAGPDCFYNLLYEKFDVPVFMEEANVTAAYYANAHNEWLNMLVNQGILGALSYTAIFAGTLIRSWRHKKENAYLLLVFLCTAGYVVNGIFSFQQVAATPLVFVVMGASEYYLRSPKR